MPHPLLPTNFNALSDDSSPSSTEVFRGMEYYSECGQQKYQSYSKFNDIPAVQSSACPTGDVDMLSAAIDQPFLPHDSLTGFHDESNIGDWLQDSFDQFHSTSPYVDDQPYDFFMDVEDRFNNFPAIYNALLDEVVGECPVSTLAPECPYVAPLSVAAEPKTNSGSPFLFETPTSLTAWMQSPSLDSAVVSAQEDTFTNVLAIEPKPEPSGNGISILAHTRTNHVAPSSVAAEPKTNGGSPYLFDTPTSLTPWMQSPSLDSEPKPEPSGNGISILAHTRTNQKLRKRKGKITRSFTELPWLSSRASAQKRKIQCPNPPCKQICSSFGDMKRHLESKAHKPPSHFCKKCGSVYTRVDALKRHLQSSSKCTRR